MAKFNFKLQSYLNVKEKIEDQKKLEYGKALKRVEEEKEKKRKLEQLLASNIVELRKKMAEGISSEQFIRYKQYLTHLEKEIIKQENEIKKAQNFAESKRVELVVAMRQKKMVETLKEHEYEQYLIDESKAEQKIVDEIVSYRYGSFDE